MSHLILVRHGQSEWNLENRFTGWVDVDLAPKGKLEAVKSGELIKEQKLKINYFFSSTQQRAIKTLKLILNTLRIKDVQIIKNWWLAERMYGNLTSLNKDDLKKKLGEKKVHEFRRSWDVRPEPLNRNSPYHPINIETYKNVPRENIPDTESLKDCYERVMPSFKNEVLSKLKDNTNILISAHGNSLRAICKYLFNLDEDKITELEIPTGNPLMIKFNSKNEITKCHYLDQERAKDLIAF